MHIVEVHDLVEPMGQMRNWFDAPRIAPRLFEFDAGAFRVAFATTHEAAALPSVWRANNRGT